MSNNPFSEVSMKAMVVYERETGRNAVATLQAGEELSATDLLGIIFMRLFTKDNAVKVSDVENYSPEQMADIIKSMQPTQDAESPST